MGLILLRDIIYEGPQKSKVAQLTSNDVGDELFGVVKHVLEWKNGLCSRAGSGEVDNLTVSKTGSSSKLCDGAVFVVPFSFVKLCDGDRKSAINEYVALG